MRAVRVTHYGQMTNTPTFAVTLDGETADTLEGLRCNARMPGSLILVNIFDVPDGTTIAEATYLGGLARRGYEKVEQAQATLYFWLADHELPHLPPRISACTPGPTPLNREQIADVLEQLAQHPNYQGQRLGVPADDDSMVVLGYDGTIEP